MYPVEQVGTHVTLREFTISDVNQTLALVGDDEVTKWLSFDSRSREEATSMVRGIIERAQADPRAEYYLAVTLPTTRNVIGFTRLGLSGVRAGKLGYAIRADQWGHGFATDAATTMLNFGFTSLHLHRISAAIGPDNAASVAVVERLGFRYEGRLRDHVFTNGQWRDSQLFSMLADEWAARQGIRGSAA